MTDLVTTTFSEGGLLSKRFPGYAPRPQQIELATAVQAAIEDHQLLLGQAPTGVGKSLAALIPAAEAILDEDARVVVVTSSIVLQEQYFTKDIPDVERVLDKSLSPALIKGRSNYLCVFKANESKILSAPHVGSEQEWDKLVDWSHTTETGDMSELDFVPHPSNWAHFAAVEDNECKGKRCSAYGACHYYRERKKVMSAKLIVCNYHYFFQALRGVGMLPEDIRVVIMDEGHSISEIARDFQEQNYHARALDRTFRTFGEELNKMKRRNDSMAAEMEGYIEEAELSALRASVASTFTSLRHYYQTRKKANSDVLMLLPQDREKMRGLVEEHLKRLQHAINKATEFSEALIGDQAYEDLQENEQDWLLHLDLFSVALHRRMSFLALFFGFNLRDVAMKALGIDAEIVNEAPPIPRDDKHVVFWMQPYGEEDVSIHIKPAKAQEWMREVLDTDIRPYTPIILSATLTVGGEFHYIRNELGIEKPHQELRVGSPFNLSNNLLWYLPQDTPPGNAMGHLDFAIGHMKQIIRELDGRSLCLFTSIKNLQEATYQLRRSLPSHIHVLAQGDLPRTQIVGELKRNPNVVVLGTKSFFTGIDVPGPNLSAVLIDKLPFPMVGDPINDYLANLPGGFWSFVIPDLCITLQQGLGRLNRTANDRGIVAVFDGRLATGQYRTTIFNSFDFKVQTARDWDVVRQYIKELNVHGAHS